jgi:hypothetical protein
VAARGSTVTTYPATLFVETTMETGADAGVPRKTGQGERRRQLGEGDRRVDGHVGLGRVSVGLSRNRVRRGREPGDADGRADR